MNMTKQALLLALLVYSFVSMLVHADPLRSGRTSANTGARQLGRIWLPGSGRLPGKMTTTAASSRDASDASTAPHGVRPPIIVDNASGGSSIGAMSTPSGSGSVDAPSSAESQAASGSGHEFDHSSGSFSAASSSGSSSSSSSSPSLNNRFVAPRWLQSSNLRVGVISALETGAMEGVAVRIAPLFVVTTPGLLTTLGDAQLLREGINHTAHVMVFAHEAIHVKRVIYGSTRGSRIDGDAAGPAENDEIESLIVLELATEPQNRVFTGIVTSEPVQDVEFPDLEVTAFDGVLRPTESTSALDTNHGSAEGPKVTSSVAFSSDDSCGTEQASERLATSLSQLCVALRPSTEMSIMTVTSPSRSAILFYDDSLVGFSVRSSNTSQGGDHQRFLRLAAPRHRAFLTAATRATARWMQQDVFRLDYEFPSYVTTFYDADGHRAKCQGVLIAPKFVLTTASCLDTTTTATEKEITLVEMYTRHDAVQHEIRTDRTVVHPQYQRTGSPEFDIALLELTGAVTLRPITLNFGKVATEDSFSRVDLITDIYFKGRPSIMVAETVTDGPPRGCAVRRDGGNATMIWGTLCVSAGHSDSVDDEYKEEEEEATSSEASSGKDDDGMSDFDVGPIEINSANLPKSMGAMLVANSKQWGPSLVGLAVVSPAGTAAAASSSSGDVFVSIATSANFINAYATGQTWGPGARAGDNHLLPLGKRFVVGLRVSRDGRNFCGGSLIASQYVLTAAHCVTDGMAKYVSIGSTLSDGSDTAEVIAVVTSTVRVHRLYNPTTYSYDAAILELVSAANAAPVILDTSLDFVHHESATMYGYGLVNAHGDALQPVVRSMKLPIWSKQECNAELPDLDDSKLCAGGERGNDACTGDSGGPLILEHEGLTFLTGFVSAGYGCGIENVPGIYTRVSALSAFVNAYTVGATWGSAGGTKGSAGSDPSSSPTPTPPSDSSSNPNPTPSSSKDLEDRTNLADDAPSPANSDVEYTEAYKSTDLVLSDLQPLVRDAFISFLLGDKEDLPAALSETVNEPDAVLRLYSTASLKNLLAILDKHSSLPLNKRKDRFQRWENDYAHLDDHRNGIDYCL